MRWLSMLFLVAVAVSACGGSSGSGAQTTRSISTSSLTQAFLALPGATTNVVGMVEFPAGGGACTVNSVFTGSGAVALYRGDPAAVFDPSRSAGVKVIGDNQAACSRTAASVLRAY
jgi:hypothetical protein